MKLFFSSLDLLQVLPMLEEVGEVHLPDLQELEVVVEPFVKEKLRPGLEPEPSRLEPEVPVLEECGGSTLTTPLESKCKFFLKN